MEMENENVPELVPVSPESVERVPVTIITGFLGSGKTTFLNHILNSCEIRDVAVVQNEYGSSVELEKSVILNSNSNVKEWLEFPNGCICCTVKDGLIVALENLIEKCKHLNHIFIETSGLADPGPLAKILWLDDNLGSSIYLDSIITFIDVKNITKHLDPKPDASFKPFTYDAYNQISIADIIIFNKLDLLEDESQLEYVKSLVRSVNSLAITYETKRSVVDLKKISHVKSFDRSLIVNYFESKNFGGDIVLDSHSNNGVTTVLISAFGSVRCESEVNLWMAKLIWEENMRIYRMKGQISIGDDECKYIVQGVYDNFEITRTEITWDRSLMERENKIVIIGHGFNRDQVESQFKKLLINFF